MSAAPDDTDLREKLCMALSDHAYGCERAEDHLGARTAYQKAVAVARSLILEEPAQAWARRQLARNLSWLGRATAGKGNARDALKFHREAVTVARTLLNEDADNKLWLGVLQDALAALGDAEETIGSIGAAPSVHKEELSLAQKIAEKSPEESSLLAVAQRAVDRLSGIVAARKHRRGAFLVSLALVAFGATGTIFEYLAYAGHIYAPEKTGKPGQFWLIGLFLIWTLYLWRNAIAAWLGWRAYGVPGGLVISLLCGVQGMLGAIVSLSALGIGAWCLSFSFTAPQFAWAAAAVIAILTAAVLAGIARAEVVHIRRSMLAVTAAIAVHILRFLFAVALSTVWFAAGITLIARAAGIWGHDALPLAHWRREFFFEGWICWLPVGFSTTVVTLAAVSQARHGYARSGGCQTPQESLCLLLLVERICEGIGWAMAQGRLPPTVPIVKTTAVLVMGFGFFLEFKMATNRGSPSAFGALLKFTFCH